MVAQNDKQISKNEEDIEENTDSNKTEKEEVREPYLKDESKLKMLIKNVNFIKTAVEQHYLNEKNMIKKPS